MKPPYPALGLALILSLACDTATAPVATGRWGGNGAVLQLGESGGWVELDCANGNVNPQWAIGNDGHFTAAGDLAFEGGPSGGQGSVRHPTNYAGTVHGSSFVLTMHLTDLDLDLGPFTMMRDSVARLVKCV
jgi:hypothetical protein